MNRRLHTLTISKDAAGEWRWSIGASNGRIVAASTEGYKRPAAVTGNLAAVTAIEARFDTSPACSPAWLCQVNLGDRRVRSRYVTVRAAA